jgi:HEXXH motif-containing protein
LTSGAAHVLTEDQFTGLANGTCSVRTVRRLVRTQNSKQRLLLWGVVDQARRRGHPQAAAAEHAYTMLAALHRRHRVYVDAVLMQPAARAWAIHTLRALCGGPARDSAVPGALAALAAAALVRSRTSAAIDLPVCDGSVMLPGVGQIMAGNAGRTVFLRSTTTGAQVTGDGVRVAIPAAYGVDAPGWRGLRTLSATAQGVPVRFVLDDLDPYRMPGATLSGRLSPGEVDSWRSAISAAWELLVRDHHAAAMEIRAVTTALTPLAPGPSETGCLRSASSQETFGCTALSSPTDIRTLAVTLVHEVQHAKLNALMGITPLTMPDDGRRYYAPWRDDPRPIEGLLHGAYAYMMVSRFWRGERRHASGAAAMPAHATFARWRAAALDVVGTLLDSGRLTRPGNVFVTAMREPLAAWNAEPVPSQAQEWARHEADRHRLRWEARNRN